MMVDEWRRRAMAGDVKKAGLVEKLGGRVCTR